MEFNRLFSHVGEAISSSGSRRFPRMLYSLISAAVPVDEIRISALAADGAPHGDLEVRSLGAVGAALAQARPPPRPDPSRLHVDDTLAGHGPTHALLDRFFLAQAAIVPLRGAQFHLATRKGGHYYLISLYRTNTFDDFAPQERTFLKELSHVLFPIVESHVAALDAAPPVARDAIRPGTPGAAVRRPPAAGRRQAVDARDRGMHGARHARRCWPATRCPPSPGGSRCAKAPSRPT
ncbi:LuxR family transcriptional regulator [Burkholderia ubonensis]|uniref:LuxR family transcriptional regulator n=1 Tax=Burkholderia ubonensis TaxID=101571 RepID=UPI000ACB9470|nr:LuxR family transcriptional regulator [Burkholderia ubonensis]